VRTRLHACSSVISRRGRRWHVIVMSSLLFRARVCRRAVVGMVMPPSRSSLVLNCRGDATSCSGKLSCFRSCTCRHATAMVFTTMLSEEKKGVRASARRRDTTALLYPRQLAGRAQTCKSADLMLWELAHLLGRESFHSCWHKGARDRLWFS
jgi:hypothetical protein